VERKYRTRKRRERLNHDDDGVQTRELFGYTDEHFEIRAMNKATEAVYAACPSWVQNTLVSAYGRRTRRERFCRLYDQMMGFLDDSQWYSWVELEEYQSQRLSELIAHAFEHVPYYRRVMNERRLRPGDIRTVDDLPKLPILTKELVREHFEELSADNCNKRSLKIGHTSGTTGSPLEVLWDRRIDVMHNVFLWRGRRWVGFEFGQPYASLLGRTIVPLSQTSPPFWRYNRPWRQLLISSFHLTKENLPQYFQALADYGVETIEAYPSTVYVLAGYLCSRGETFPLKRVVTSSETLLPIQRDAIQEAFQCPVYDAYSETERVMFSAECEQRNGHHYHAEFGILELVDEGAESVSHGQPGKVVATGLHNYAMPLIRYEMDDVTAFSSRSCDCGRGLPLLAPITTKAEDIVVLRDGRFVSASALTHPFKPLTSVEKSQIIQEDYDRIVVKIVPRNTYTDRDTEQLLTRMRERLGNGVSVDVELVSDIPRTKSGKYRWVISKVPLAFGEEAVSNLYSTECSGRQESETAADGTD
jgi:phenylacetate-CoA ligase